MSGKTQEKTDPTLFPDDEPAKEVTNEKPVVEVLEAEEPEAGAAGPDVRPMSLLGTQQSIELAKKRIQERIDAQQLLRKAALSFTNHRDWVCHQAESGELEPYLQEIGSEKLIHAFSIEPEIQERIREDNRETSTFEIIIHGRVRCFVYSEIWYPVIGGRWSGDGFFQKGIRSDPGDVRKSADANFYNRAVKKVLGLRGITFDELEDCPTIDAKRIKVVRYSEGNRGGSSIPDLLKGDHLIVYIPYPDQTARGAIKKVKDSRYHGEPHPVTGNEKCWLVPDTEKNRHLIADLHANNGEIKWKECAGTEAKS